MKNSRLFTTLLAFCLLTINITLNAQDGFCPGNLFQNGDLELGTPTTGDQDINQAVGFSQIWSGTSGSTSWADYYNSTNGPSTWTPPQPPTGNYAGFWCANNNSTSTTYREGLFNTLNTPISDNTGIYSFTFDLACLGGWGTAELAIYGIYNPSGAVSTSTPITNHAPPNEAFFGVANTMELGLVPINTCSNTKVTQTITFDTADPTFPAGGITHILLTHSSNIISGIRYVGVDNFCMAYEGPSPVTDCVTVINENTICNTDGSITYDFDFIYHGTLPADNFIVTDMLGNTLTNIGGLSLVNGSTYSTVSFTIPAGSSTFCFRLRLFGEAECCYIEHCIELPICNPCDSVWVESFPLDDEGDCCYSISAVNNFSAVYFTNITSRIITPGVTFSNPVANGGWSVAGSGNTLNWTPPGFVPLGSNTGVMDFCLDNIVQYSQIPQTVVFDWWTMDATGALEIVCSDTLQFDCSGCLFVSDDMIDCNDDGTYNYNFTVWNNTSPAHDATHLRIVPLMPDVCLDGNSSMTPLELALPSSPLSSGGSANLSFNIADCGAGLVPGSVIPFRLILVDNGEDLDWCCHVDTLWITIPDCPNGDGCDCQDMPDDVTQGFTVSGNSCTRTFTPIALEDCDSVRWHIDGAIVGNTSSNAPFTYTFGNGNHNICMIVTRYADDGTICEREYCINIQVMCIIGQNGDPIGKVPTKAELMLELYPNPVIDLIYLEIPTYKGRMANNDAKVKHVEVFHINGKKMNLNYKQVNARLASDKMSLDVSSLPLGTYLVKITLDDGNIATEKFIKIQ